MTDRGSVASNFIAERAKVRPSATIGIMDQVKKLQQRRRRRDKPIGR